MAQSIEWLTPQWLITRLAPFDLDPCAPVKRPWGTAKRHYTVQNDGLSRPWTGLVWCNPPYGREAIRWVARLADHGNGIALLFARTDTELWHQYVWPNAHSVVFLRGRLHFCHPAGMIAQENAGAASVLVAYGAKADLRLRRAALPGMYIALWGGRVPRILHHSGRCIRTGIVEEPCTSAL